MVTPTVDLDRFAARHLRVWEEISDASWVTVDGTLVFVDISGFTALSEKLAVLGRVGAEELTEVLNRVFGEMLDLAAARGGTLLKYGGDALLLLFEGPDHAVQAASATVEMRAALRKAADIPTSVGRVALRMSQGVHSGEIHLFRAVGSHSEMILAGPAASEVTFMEGTAEAGEIVVSEATKALLPPDSAVEKKGEGWFLRWRTPRIDPLEAIDGSGPGTTDIASLIPVGLRSFLSAGRPDSEHRQATVAFVKLLGIDELLITEGAAATAAALGDAIEEITTIVDEEEVTFLATDVDLDACKVILVSGVPTTRVDEEGRMLRTVRRIADIDTPFGLKVGVNRGDVFSGEVGGSDRSTYTIMGDTVNLAARLMAAAPKGEIYATPAVIDRSLTLYETGEVEPFHVKGKTAPVRAFSIGDEIGTRTRHGTSATVFVGRTEEVDLLSRAIDRARSGSGAAFTVSGPTGIGKTRLADEVTKDVDVPVIETRAEPYGTTNPYRPFRDPLRAILGVDRSSNDDMADGVRAGIRRLTPGLEPLAPLIGDIAHVEMEPTPETATIDPRFRQERTADAAVELLAAAHPGPLVLLAEDMHWADPATATLLTRLVHETASRPWVIIATTRETVVDGTMDVPLGPLGRDDLEDMIHAATEAAPLRPEVVRAMVERSGGSPLFTSELITIVRDTGDVSSLPTSLDGVLGSQIDSLAPLPRRVLRYLSVLGRSFRTAIARDYLRTQGIELDHATRSTLDAFIDADGEDRLQFRHAMVRDVAYEGLSYRMRRDLHLRAGEILVERFAGAEESVADILALHFSSAGDADRAWRFCTMAGDHSMEMYANAEAATQFERALDASRRLQALTESDRRSVWVKLGDVRERSGLYGASLEAYRQAARLARNDPTAHGEVLLRRARAKERSGRFSAALADATRTLREADAVGGGPRAADALRAKALAFSAVLRQAQQRPRDALRVATNAAEVAARVGDESALARAWMVIDWSHFILGEPEKAIHSANALKIYEQRGDFVGVAQAASNLGGFSYWMGDWDRALEYYEVARDANQRVGDFTHVALHSANIGEVLVAQGRCDRASGLLVDARRTFLATEFWEGVAFTDLLLGRTYGIQGDLERSEESLLAAIERSRDLGIDGAALEASVYLADVYRRSGRAKEALDLISRAVGEAPQDYVDHYSPLIARVRGSIQASLGEPDRAESTLRDGIRAADERSDVYERSLLILTLERLLPGSNDADDLASSREALASLGVTRGLQDLDLEASTA